MTIIIVALFLFTSALHAMCFASLYPPRTVALPGPVRTRITVPFKDPATTQNLVLQKFIVAENNQHKNFELTHNSLTIYTIVNAIKTNHKIINRAINERFLKLSDDGNFLLKSACTPHCEAILVDDINTEKTIASYIVTIGTIPLGTFVQFSPNARYFAIKLHNQNQQLCWMVYRTQQLSKDEIFSFVIKDETKDTVSFELNNNLKIGELLFLLPR